MKLDAIKKKGPDRKEVFMTEEDVVTEWEEGTGTGMVLGGR